CDAILYVGALRSTNADDGRRVRAELDPLGKQTLGAAMFARVRSPRPKSGRANRRRTGVPGEGTGPSRRRGTTIGDPPKRKALRHVVRSRVSEHPKLYLPLARLRHPGPSPKVVSNDTELVIDGYTRSACTFAVYAFQLAQQAPRHANRASGGNGTGAP